MPKVISAREAFDAGLTRYFTGKPCGHGHIAERMISNGSCVQCLGERSKIHKRDAYERTKVWRLLHPEARAEEARKYRAKHPEKVAETVARWRERHPERAKEQARDSKRRMRATDPGKERARIAAWKERKQFEAAGRPKPADCDICGALAIGRIVFDHCHVAGKFRGWLCDRCNKVLGLVKDNAAVAKAMAAYLERHNGEADDLTTQCAGDRAVCAPADSTIPG